MCKKRPVHRQQNEEEEILLFCSCTLSLNFSITATVPIMEF